MVNHNSGGNRSGLAIWCVSKESLWAGGAYNKVWICWFIQSYWICRYIKWKTNGTPSTWKEIKEKFTIQEKELRAQVKTIETKLQKLRSELNDGLTKIERDVSTIDSVVDEKFKTLWMMINNK